MEIKPKNCLNYVTTSNYGTLFDFEIASVDLVTFQTLALGNYYTTAYPLECVLQYYLYIDPGTGSTPYTGSLTIINSATGVVTFNQDVVSEETLKVMIGINSVAPESLGFIG